MGHLQIRKGAFKGSIRCLIRWAIRNRTGMIFQEVANRMGANWNYSHPCEIMDEAASLAALFAGVSYDRLEGFNSQVWPVHKRWNGYTSTI